MGFYQQVRVEVFSVVQLERKEFQARAYISVRTTPIW